MILCYNSQKCKKKKRQAAAFKAYTKSFGFDNQKGFFF